MRGNDAHHVRVVRKLLKSRRMYSKKLPRRERQRLVAPLAATQPTRPTVETVEAFLARGGAIEQLDPGARSQPYDQTFRQTMTLSTVARKERGAANESAAATKKHSTRILRQHEQGS